MYAFSSSVYVGNQKVPFSTDDKVDNPILLYAAIKKSKELLAHAYQVAQHSVNCFAFHHGLWACLGYLDMFYYSATQRLIKGETTHIFNYGNCKRDFIYINDIVEGV